MHGTAVEVRKNPKSTTWYNAVILDLKGDNIQVGFEENIWPSREVPAHSVRRCPVPLDNDSGDFDPKVDEVVEVSVSASESNPSGWSLGRVKTIRNSFYFIGFVSTQKGSQDLIVERNALRRVNAESAIVPSQLVRRVVRADPGLHPWLRSEDSAGCLSHVQTRSRVLIARVDNTDGDEPEVVLVGDARAVELGENLLVFVHFKNQQQIQRFHEFREQLLARLQEQQQWYSSQIKEVFVVEQSCVGKIIGAKGVNIKAVKSRHNVDIELEEGATTESGEAGSTVTVTGESTEDVQKAREELEYVVVRVPVEQDQIGWILGKGFQNISDVAKKTELHYARFDDKTTTLELCGLKHQVEDAKMLISVHREYLPVYKDMDEERTAIEQSFDELDLTKGSARKGKGGGCGGGGWKGKESKGEDNGWSKGDDNGNAAGRSRGRGRGSGTADRSGAYPSADEGRDGKGESGKRKGEGRGRKGK